ncbi:PREDICTED: uncharacterized protein LOC109593209 isoform X2 [Amphimedon queenslandica]|uniref:Fanconi anemia core complex-associated protein 100 n=1 Tax=Amphimedon queenslandica TaxID=400682 RepID=A0AAN0K482_AMPQE|nr:PREDICTED: uncharacterized protein LOC109593209 isoform X2 [Amphimedon queenslandica]|eukprot:XP_019863970.1 PREDICTED: uncharacterized protein LOC109593209 isoform X2 [Amphimedon queenslandica]
MADVVHVQQILPLANAPLFATNGHKVLLMTGNKAFSSFELRNEEYQKISSVECSLRDVISLSCTTYPWIVISEGSGIIHAINWDKLLETKTTSQSQGKEDIFASLLDMESNPKPSKLSKYEAKSSPISLTTISHLKTGSLLYNGALIAFSTSPDSLCYKLNIWRPSLDFTDSQLPSFPLQPDSVISHSITHSGSHSACNRDIPYLVVCSATSDPSDGVVMLSLELYAYLFDPEETLGQSQVIIYGCECGNVFGASIKRLHNPTVSTNNEGLGLILLCSVGQPVLSIYGLSQCNSLINNSLLIIGTLGKILLLQALPNTSTVSTQEVLLGGPILSSLLIPGNALLLSNLRSVQLICLKCNRDDDSSFLSGLFEHPVTLLSSPHYLLSYNETSGNHFAVLGLRIDGQLSTIKLPSNYTKLLEMQQGITIRDQLKHTLKSIEETTNISQRLDSDISLIDSRLTALNQMCCLFTEQLDSSFPPLKVDVIIKHGQLDTSKKQYFLNVVLSLKKGQANLKKGCFLIIEMKPGCMGLSAVYLPSSPSAITESNTHSLSLEGLSSDKALSVSLPVPNHLLYFYHVSVNCSISFSPSTVSLTSTFLVPLSQQFFTLLDFIQPLRHDRSLISETVSESISITISDSLIRDYLKEDSIRQSSLLSSVFVRLLGNYRQQETSEYIFKTKDSRGNDSTELFCMLPDDSIARIKLQSNTLKDESSSSTRVYLLTVTGANLLNTVHLTDVISQLLQVKLPSCSIQLKQQFKMLGREFTDLSNDFYK